MNITITRRSTVGFGYEEACENDSRGDLVVCDVLRPCHSGTIKQVAAAIESDRTLASFKSGGTYYRVAWFVRVSGKWMKLINDEYYNPYQLVDPFDPWKSVTVEVSK
jgi:hypothetical protein